MSAEVYNLADERRKRRRDGENIIPDAILPDVPETHHGPEGRQLEGSGSDVRGMEQGQDQQDQQGQQDQGQQLSEMQADMPTFPNDPAREQTAQAEGYFNDPYDQGGNENLEGPTTVQTPQTELNPEFRQNQPGTQPETQMREVGMNQESVRQAPQQERLGTFESARERMRQEVSERRMLLLSQAEQMRNELLSLSSRTTFGPQLNQIAELLFREIETIANRGEQMAQADDEYLFAEVAVEDMGRMANFLRNTYDQEGIMKALDSGIHSLRRVVNKKAENLLYDEQRLAQDPNLAYKVGELTDYADTLLNPTTRGVELNQRISGVMEVLRALEGMNRQYAPDGANIHSFRPGDVNSEDVFRYAA